MNVLVEILWGGYTYRVAMRRYEYDGKQYANHLLSISPIFRPAALHGDFESTTTTLTLWDVGGKYRALLSDFATSENQGAEVIIRYENGVRAATLSFVEAKPGNQGEVIVILSNAIRELSTTSPINERLKVTKAEFPEAPNFGDVINWFSGAFRHPSTAGINSLKAYRVNDTDYVLGLAGGGTPTLTGTGTDVLKSDFSTSVKADVSIAGPASPSSPDQKYYIRRNDPATWTEPFLYVNFSFDYLTTKEVIESVMDYWFSGFEYESDALSVLGVNGWHRDPVASLQGGTRDAHFSITRETTGIEILSRICKENNVHYRLQKTGKIAFFVINWLNISAERVFPLSLSRNFTHSPGGSTNDRSKIANYISAEYDFQPHSGTYLSSYGWPKDESIQKLGYRHEQTQYRQDSFIPQTTGLPDSSQPVFAVKKHVLVEKKFPEKIRRFDNVPLENIDFLPGQCLKFPHPFLESEDQKLFMIQRISGDFMNETASLDLIDISSLETIDKECVFNAPSLADFEGQAGHYDFSIGGHNFLDDGTDVRHTLADNNGYTSSCVSFDGVDDFLEWGNSERYPLTNIWDTARWSFWVWAKFPTLGNSEYIYSCHANPVNDFWYIRKTAANQLLFQVYEGAVLKVSVSSSATISDNNWHLITFHKYGIGSGNDVFAFYIDGAQVAYFTQAAYIPGTPYPFTAGLSEGRTYRTGANLFAEFKRAQVGIWQNSTGPQSHFLNPTPGLTDSFTVPVGVWGDHIDRTFTK